MARNFTTEERELLRSDSLQARLLTTWWMDSGTYRFCDDVFNLDYGGFTWIGANALFAATDIKATSGWAAESVTITIDGQRLFQAGADPASFFQNILAADLHNRRVDIELGLMPMNVQNPVLVIPLYSGKINHPRLVDPKRDLSGASEGASRLDIVLDSLALRYQWVVGRTRSHEDQLEIDPTDHFFSFVSDNLRAEQNLYWGKKAPDGINAGRDAVQGALNQFYGIDRPQIR